MACLGGTPEDPRTWFRYNADGEPTRITGRICSRTNPRTSRRKCPSCPAFRGVGYGAADVPGEWRRGHGDYGRHAQHIPGQVMNGLVRGDSDPYALSASEHEQYQAAMDEALVEDNFGPLGLFLSRMERELRVVDGRRAVIVGAGLRTLRDNEDEYALSVWADRAREWRAAHPGADKRKRKRAAYMREYRARRKVEA